MFTFTRHTFAARLIELGVDILTVSKLLGHSDIRTTMIYAKAGVGVLRDAVERLDAGDGKVLAREGERRAILLGNTVEKICPEAGASANFAIRA